MKLLGIGLIVTLPAGSAVVVLRPAPSAVVVAAPTPSAGAAVVAPATPPDLAVRLQALLGQHSVLAAGLMRSRIRGDDDFVQAADAALSRNSDAMTDLIGRLFGAATARQFAPLWSGHVVELFAYARALADGDDAGRERARTELLRYERELGAYFATASRGRLPVAAAHGALSMHVGHLTAQADAYARRDYATADRLHREGYRHLYDLGLTLSETLLPAGQGEVLRRPLWRLRSQLGKLLAEHVLLITDLTRAAVADTPDFTAAADAINGNTRDFAAAVGTLFGAPAGREFQSLWASHVEQLVAYASAAADGDRDAQQAARDRLRRYGQRLASFLSAATGERTGARQLAAAMSEHDGMLMRHADAYAARDYPAAHEIAHHAYDHQFEMARALADGFGAEIASRLPRGGAQTGYGGLARRD